jgi:hypothetical protein
MSMYVQHVRGRAMSLIEVTPFAKLARPIGTLGAPDKARVTDRLRLAAQGRSAFSITI